MIGSLSVTDPDAGDTHTFSVNDDRFEVVNGQLKIKDGVFLDYEALNNGQLPITVTATDAGGLSYAKNFTINVNDINETPADTTPPDAPVIAQVAGDDRVNSTEKTAGITISGTAEANSIVNVTWGETVLTTTAGANGSWSQNFTSAQIPTDGTTTISVTATDAAGNTSTASTRSVLIDTVAPTAPAITSIGGEDGTVSSIAGDANVTGTADAGSIVTLRFGNTVLGTATAGNDGSWSYTLSSGNITEIGQGADKSITAAVADAAGNTSTASQTFAVDTVAPNAPSITNVTDNVGSIQGSVAAGGSTDDSTPTLVIGLANTNAVAGDTVRLFNGTTQIAAQVLTSANISAGNVSITPSALLDGSYSVTARITDVAGNQGVASTASSFTIDTVAPTAPTIAQVAGDNIVNSAEKTAGVTVSGIAEANSTLNITWGSTTQTATADASGNWSGAFSSAQIPTDGNTTITATTRDAAGNTSTAVTRSVLIDTLAPTAPAITNIGGADSTVSSVAGDAQVVGTAEANSTVTVRFGSTVLGTATTGSNGSWAYALTSANITTIGQGTNKTITASAADAAGNTSLSASRTFAVDTLAPNGPSITNVTDNVGSITGSIANGGSTDDTTPTFAISLTGTSAVAGDTVRLFNGSTQIATSTLTSNDITAGSVSITPTALAQGNYFITASITDVAGNQSAASTARTFTLNTTSPTAPVINGFSNVSGNTLTLTGTAEAGSTVAILNGNTTLGTVVAGNNGSWSFGTTSLTNGTFNITASATNLAGNTSPLSAASNIIAGTTANNSLTGTNANNVLVGYAGNDSLSGDNGNDTLLGGDGSDTLLGGNGDDILVGGSGDDILTGGNGNDRFVYQAFSDRGTVGDSITDFNSSQDKLVLTDLFRSVNYSGSNPIADGYLRFTQSGTSTQVQIDQDGLANGSNFNTLATLNNVTPGSLTIGTNVVI